MQGQVAFVSENQKYLLDNQNEGVIMQILFKRRVTNELLTTYLPSFFLLGICYSTIHFKSFYFEAAVTVNLTVMLVATTLFVRFFELIVPKGHIFKVILQCHGEASINFLPQIGRHLANYYTTCSFCTGSSYNSY